MLKKLQSSISLILFNLILTMFIFLPKVSAQKVLQMEKTSSYKTEKLYIGEEITYRIKGDDTWYHSAIRELLVEENIIVFHNRYVHMDSIVAFRWERHKMKAMGKQLFWFGTAWSAFAAVGTATDRNDDTSYRLSDAAVTGTSWLLALIVPKIFRYKKRKFGKRRRLRMLDLTPVNEMEKPKA